MVGLGRVHMVLRCARFKSYEIMASSTWISKDTANSLGVKPKLVSGVEPLQRFPTRAMCVRATSTGSSLGPRMKSRGQRVMPAWKVAGTSVQPQAKRAEAGLSPAKSQACVCPAFGARSPSVSRRWHTQRKIILQLEDSTSALLGFRLA